MISSLRHLLVAMLMLLRNGFVRTRLGRHPWLAAVPRRLYRRFLARMVARTGLFDADYYAQVNPDVVAAGWEGLHHYVAAGDLEGRMPMPLFDPAWYREKVGEPIVLNALLHYAWFGRQRGIPPSRWFDPAYYVSRYPDVAAAGVDPLQHFLQRGGLEGRSPSPHFDTQFYLQTNADVVASRANPLIHWLVRGRAEGRKPTPGSGEPTDDLAPREPTSLARPSLPTESEWAAAVSRKDGPEARIDVVIPVYTGRTETLRCILSAINAPARVPFAVHVIDDASPDPELVHDLHYLAERGLFTLHANHVNQGFVRTANRGMGLHVDRDVVLLNADAEVFGDWLDRLRAAAYRHPRTGTVTPLSNNATICSYPRTLQDNNHPLEVDDSEVDHLASLHNSGFEVEAPTGHGFCLYLRRDCLLDVGAFDERGFGRGYGEENDLCQRALRRGWRNVIVGDVFVRHWGSASFRDEQPVRVAAALREIARRYPSYDADVARFCVLDPLAPARRTLDWQRLRLQSRAHNTLVVCHGRGGGTERQVQAELARLAAEDRGAFLMRPSAAGPGHVALSSPKVRGTPNLQPMSLSDTTTMAAQLGELGIDHILVHSLVDFPTTASVEVGRLAGDMRVPYDVVVHDYESICPRLTLSDEQGRYCGEPDVSACNTCIKRRGAEVRVTDNGAWRAQRGQFLRQARSVVVPDLDVADRLRRYFADLSIEVRPHEDPADLPLPVRMASVPLRVPGRVRIAVLGAIGRHKGYDILHSCAAQSRRRKLPLEFVLLGHSVDDARLAAAGVRVTGRYVDDHAVQALLGLEADVVWLPSCWPETYSFTLSIALRARLPVVAFDLGAIARRLRCGGVQDQLLPLSLASRPEAINAFFLQRVGAGRVVA